MTSKLWRLLRGYVIIKIKGPRLERFLNRLAKADVRVWDGYRLSSDMLVVSVGLKGFRKVRALCRAQGWKVAIVDRAGLPFLIAGLRRRQGMIWGGMLAVALLYFASGFIWIVQIQGDDDLPLQRISEIAADLGLRPGVPRERVDRHEIQKGLLLGVDDLGWASVQIRGALAVLEVVGRAGVNMNEMRPGDMVAARDGVITKVVVFSGQQVVEEGATVKKGDVLISGFIPPTAPEHRRRLDQGDIPYERADGLVTAQVWYEGTALVPFVDVVQTPTGEQSAYYEMTLGSFTWHIGRNPPPYRAYREETSRWERHFGPVVLDVQRTFFTEVLEEQRVISRAEAEALGRAAALERLQAQLGSEAAGGAEPEFVVEIVEQEGAPALWVTARMEVVEPISAFRERQ